MDKLAYIRHSQKEANQKIWNSLMNKYELLKKKNTLLAYLWFPVACIFFGFVAVFSWMSFLILLFKDIRFTPHYMRTVIAYNNMTKEEEKEYIDKQLLDYKKWVSYGNLSTEKQSQINATFDLLYKENTDKFDKMPVSPPIQQPEIAVKDFKSTLNKKQIEILVECINKIKVLETSVTIDLMQQILSCTTKQPLEISSKKNKLLIYLFYELYKHYYIASTWQAVCAQNKIFLTSEKKVFLNQDIISTTVNTFQDYPPKDSHIIDNYIKHLQEH
ncbi:hypothetical protein [Dysgonomonas sp. 25]|uniref:hypothetical protein n=1 Tax=Dysgonomonas sp. 25 TaxID=2302933 RepID=UPI0013D059D8|nr:hypothetical protein [Dysgonomonas sp. 25]NDV68426.1 hypothetical protein [Dysgonomonas sp. 25]